MNIDQRSTDSGPSFRIFVNEDLIKTRQGLLYELRKLKKDGFITDCWSFNGNMLCKDANNVVRQVRSKQEVSSCALRNACSV